MLLAPGPESWSFWPPSLPAFLRPALFLPWSPLAGLFGPWRCGGHWDESDLPPGGRSASNDGDTALLGTPVDKAATPGM